MTKRTINALWIALLMLVASAPAALAGGFYVQVDAPSTADAGKYPPGTVLVVRPEGCHDPSAAALEATAEGIVDGQRKSIKLELKEVSKGVYALSRQWPTTGRWVLAINGAYRDAERGVLVRLGAGNQVNLKEKTAINKRAAVQIEARKLTAADIDAALI